MTARQKISVWGGVAGALLLAASWVPWTATAQAPAPTGSRTGATSGRTLSIMLRSSALTPDQKSQVQAILSSRRLAARALIRDLRQAQDDLSDKLLSSGPLGLSDLEPQLSKISQVRDKLVQNSAQTTLDIRAVLTPEQLARASQVKDRLRELRSEIRQLLNATEP